MILLKEIISVLEEWAPPSLQESYDNSGLLTGDANAKVNKALITLDLTEPVVDEAIDSGCNLIISHHPFIFSGIKRVTGRSSTERILIKAIKNDLFIYALHTNLDNIQEGVNKAIAEKLGMKNTRILRPIQGQLKKLVTFCPLDHADKVRDAIFKTGAGHIGKYDQCSFNAIGQGSFRAGTGANPYVGEKDKIHFENEVRIESIFPAYDEQRILKSLIEAHPYEEVAYDIYPLDNTYDKIGAGMLGILPIPVAEKTFLQKLKELFGTKVIRHSRLLGRDISQVAICGGSGSFLIQDALSSGAQVFVTGDVKYHQFFDGDDKMLIADIGHYESEQFTRELIYDYLMQKFPNFALQISKQYTNSVNYF